jgi:hypothetical protein
VSIRSALPWLLVLLSVPVAALVLDGTAALACDELQGAFSRGVLTAQSDTLSVVASHCETTDLVDGSTIEKTVINWSGLITAAAILVGAWFLGAGLAGTANPRRALLGIIGAGAVSGVALVVFFA